MQKKIKPQVTQTHRICPNFCKYLF